MLCLTRRDLPYRLDELARLGGCGEKADRQLLVGDRATGGIGRH